MRREGNRTPNPLIKSGHASPWPTGAHFADLALVGAVFDVFNLLAFIDRFIDKPPAAAPTFATYPQLESVWRLALHR